MAIATAKLAAQIALGSTMSRAYFIGWSKLMAILPGRPSDGRRTSFAVAAPTLDGALDDAFLVAGLAPGGGETRIGRSRALFRLQVVEADADRDGDTFAADDAFAVAERGDCIEEAARAFRHRRTDAGLVPVVVQAHRDDRAALRQHAFGKVGRTLCDKTQRYAIFTAFLGDPLEDLAHGLAARVLVLGDVTVGLFADQKDRALRFGARPDGVVEHHARKH